MSEHDAQQVLAALLGECGKRFVPSVTAPPHKPDEVGPAIHLLLYSFMLWESTPTPAAQSLARLYDSFVDLNELRVAFAHEIAESLGQADVYAAERAERVRATLNDMYAREHAVSIDHLAEAPKREVRDYLESLEGMPGFVAARVTLLCFGGHAIPVDALLADKLCEAGVIAPSVSPDKAGRWLERHIRAGQAHEAVLLMDAWREGPKAAATEPVRSGADSVGEQMQAPSASELAHPHPPNPHPNSHPPDDPPAQTESPQSGQDGG